MSNQQQIYVCQRCAFGFVLTPTYQDFLARWGANVIVPVQCPNCFYTGGPLPKQCGKVKWFNSHKHYGFLITEEGKEIFFHQNQLLEGNRYKPQEGQKARFHVRHSIKGPEALNVELVRELGR